MEAVEENNKALTKTVPKVLTVDLMQSTADAVMMRGLKAMNTIIKEGADEDKITAYRNVISFGKYVYQRRKDAMKQEEGTGPRMGVVFDEGMRI